MGGTPFSRHGFHIRSALLLLLVVGGCKSPRFRSGLEILAEKNFAPLAEKRVALVTNQTGLDGELRSVIDLLAESPMVRLVAVFGPEHGFRGAAAAGIPVEDVRVPRADVPVYSLYGKTRRPAPEMLRGVDVVLFDIQDIGVRTYTYLATLVEVLWAAADARLEVWVLDRPVPLGGVRFEGPLLEPEMVSFVGPHTLPLRHGLTAGEFALLVNAERGIGADLRVVEMQGYRRDMLYGDTGLVWVAPSPNIPTVETALVYAGTVLVEGTNLSEGRGTTRPFHLIGAPWVDGYRLARQLNGLGFKGLRFREASFTPVAGKYRGDTCSGVEIHVTDPRLAEPVAAAVALIDGVNRLHPGSLTFREKVFDRLAGTSRLRREIVAGVPFRKIVRSWHADLESYRDRRERFLLYE